MKLLLAFFLLTAGPALAADKAAPDDKTAIKLVNYFLKVDVADANPVLVEPFLAVKIETLPKKLQLKAEEKQIEIRGLIRAHDAKKKGMFIPPPPPGCSEKDFVLPLSQAHIYVQSGYEEVSEQEFDYVRNYTKCTEIDLGCRFTLKIFFQEKKPRRLMFNASDPIMGVVAASHGNGGGSHLFGSGLSCLH